jgi:predicted DNA binding CopG/RHH family protein
MKERERKKTRRKVEYLKSVEEIPDFKSEEEEIEFWKTHSLVDILDELPEVKVEISGELRKRIEDHKKKKLLTLRLDPAQIDKAKEIAIKKGVGYLTLMRNWIQQGIERESYNKYGVEASIQPQIEDLIKTILENLIKRQLLFSNLTFPISTQARVPHYLRRGESVAETKSAPFATFPPDKIENPLGISPGRVLGQVQH